MPSRVSSLIPWVVPFGLGRTRAPVTPSPTACLPPEWLRDHAGTLWRVIVRLGVPRHQVEDVLQETFITAARRHADIAAGRERAFLIGTATRLCANYRRRAHVRNEVGDALDEQVSDEPDAERLLIRKRLRERLDRALSSLSEAHRSVFVLYELEGLSTPEIGELLGLPLGTVASRLGRARAKFAEAAARLEHADGPLEEP